MKSSSKKRARGNASATRRSPSSRDSASPDQRLFTPRPKRRTAGHKFEVVPVRQAKALYFRREELLAEARELAAQGKRDAALKIVESLVVAEKLLAYHHETHEKAFTRAEHLLIDIDSQSQPTPPAAGPNWAAMNLSERLLKDDQAAAVRMAALRQVSVPGFIADCVRARVADLQGSCTLNERAHILSTALYEQRGLLLDRARALASGTDEQIEAAKTLSDALRLAEELLVSHGYTVDTARPPVQAVAHSLASL